MPQANARSCSTSLPPSPRPLSSSGADAITCCPHIRRKPRLACCPMGGCRCSPAAGHLPHVEFLEGGGRGLVVGRHSGFADGGADVRWVPFEMSQGVPRVCRDGLLCSG